MKTIQLIAISFVIWTSQLCMTTMAEEALYAIRGKVMIKEIGTVYIYLVNEAGFSIPLSGVQQKSFKVGSAELEPGYISFVFRNIPTGEYGIRCFQDINGDGKLNKGLFGPSEPWGMSFNTSAPAKWPRFKEVAFMVNTDSVRHPSSFFSKQKVGISKTLLVIK